MSTTVSHAQKLISTAEPDNTNTSLVRIKHQRKTIKTIYQSYIQPYKSEKLNAFQKLFTRAYALPSGVAVALKSVPTDTTYLPKEETQ
ncbi:hypothetical protein [Aliamphritea spongicola]|uniref:hypothetical protein n=1 Tax=Aliamphritea spongicola TaxID=707589 RepID=UPI00196B7622|nr:hypothetical protein [Aliamphritea spongicola]MBN3562546.1 hypothetical protein [Aliamphritea spongicola]